MSWKFKIWKIFDGFLNAEQIKLKKHNISVYKNHLHLNLRRRELMRHAANLSRNYLISALRHQCDCKLCFLCILQYISYLYASVSPWHFNSNESAFSIAARVIKIHTYHKFYYFCSNWMWIFFKRLSYEHGPCVFTQYYWCSRIIE